MKKNLYVVSEEYRKKDIYVYGVSRESVDVFANITLHNGEVAGFVDDSGSVIGDSFMNRVIISEEEFEDTEAAVLVLPGFVTKDSVKTCKEKFYWREVLEVNLDIGEKNIYVYGLGEVGKKLCKKLDEENIEIKGVCISDRGGYERWNGRTVVDLEEIEQEEDCAIILATEKDNFLRQMLRKVECYQAELYLPDIISQNYISNSTFFQCVAKAVREHKKIYVYGNKNDWTDLILIIFRRYGVKIEGVVYKEENQVLGIKNVYDLIYEKLDDIMIAIASDSVDEVSQAGDILESIGLTMGRLSYASVDIPHTSPYVFAYPSNYYEQDSLFSQCAHHKGKYPGIIVLGDDQAVDIKIFVVGGSTSTVGLYKQMTWVEYLYKKMKNMGYSLTVYNAASAGYNAADELLRLIRDACHLKPDYVIAFSGVNNLYENLPSNRFLLYPKQSWSNKNMPNGVETSEDAYDFWHRMIRLEKLVSEFLGAKYLAFLQPMNLQKRNKNVFERSFFEVLRCSENARLFAERADQVGGEYINLISLFEDKEGMY
ncbi:MAG: hypothetical protein K2G55_11065, partial [Lachnospiraceae bacterium]|nr:hypothetical protein [Lachnospiraceae bacterium]